jgi:hypothetical protein
MPLKASGRPTVSRSFSVEERPDVRVTLSRRDGNQGAGHANHTHGNGAEVAQDPLSLPSGPITRLRAKGFKEALNGLIQENWADSKNTKMGSNNNQGLVHVIKAIEEDN